MAGLPERPRILVVDDEMHIVQYVLTALDSRGYPARGADSPKKALDLLKRQPFEMLITDLLMPGIGGVELLRRAKGLRPGIIGLVMTAFADKEKAVAALQEGAADFIDKPFRPERLLEAVGRAWQRYRIEFENFRLMAELSRVRRAARHLAGGQRLGLDLETRSEAMRQACRLADLVADDPDMPVLLLGEAGAGKGWMARRIHARSERAPEPFLELNCGGVPAGRLEQELFGAEGLAEAACGGSLLLEGVTVLPDAVQEQLISLIEQRAFWRNGGRVEADVRVMLTSHDGLERPTSRSRLRPDLFLRLSRFPVTVPPLRERPEDIPELARLITRELATQQGQAPLALDRRLIEALSSYGWPGNVAELRNALERALLVSGGATLEVGHLPEAVRGGAGAAPVGSGSLRLEDVEREHIFGVLRRLDGNRTRAAEALGISRSTLKRKLASYPRELKKKR